MEKILKFMDALKERGATDITIGLNDEGDIVSLHVVLQPVTPTVVVTGGSRRRKSDTERELESNGGGPTEGRPRVPAGLGGLIDG